MDSVYNSIIEALIFSSDEPLEGKLIIDAIKGLDGSEISIGPDDIENVVDALNTKYNEDGRSFNIVRLAGGYIFATKPEYAKYLGYLASEKSKRRLSAASLETLAIIAYKQPITKPEIESIRGVNSDSIIGTLLEKSLITITGRAEKIGRPLLYATTDEFLKYFGLNRLSDLPKPREIEEILKDEDFVDQKRKLLMSELEENMEKEIAEAGNENKDQ